MWFWRRGIYENKHIFRFFLSSRFHVVSLLKEESRGTNGSTVIERVSRTFLLEQGNFPWQQNRAESPPVFHPDSLICWPLLPLRSRPSVVHSKFRRVSQLQSNKNGRRQATRGYIYMATHGCMRVTRGAATSLQLPHRKLVYAYSFAHRIPHRRDMSARAQAQLRIFVTDTVTVCNTHTHTHTLTHVEDDAFTHRIHMYRRVYVCMHSHAR